MNVREQVGFAPGGRAVQCVSHTDPATSNQQSAVRLALGLALLKGTTTVLSCKVMMQVDSAPQTKHSNGTTDAGVVTPAVASEGVVRKR